MAIGTPVASRPRTATGADGLDRVVQVDALVTDGVQASSPRAGTKLCWLVGGGLLLLLAAYLAIGHWRGAVQWQRFRDAAAVVQAEFDAREPSRPALWGEAVGGPAWPHYERAFAMFSMSSDDGYLPYLARVEGRRLAGVANTERLREGPPAVEVVVDNAPALAALREGAHCTDGKRPMDWSAGFNLRVQTLLTARHLANAGALAAIVAASDGDGQQCVRIMLDVMQLGRDLVQSPLLIEQMIGCAVMQVGGWMTIDWSNLLRHLDADALGVFAVGLARLDAALPLEPSWIATGAVLLAHHASNVHHVSHVLAKSDDSLTGRPWDTWRYGFSPRLALAQHGLSQLQLAKRVQALCSGRDAVDVVAIERLFAETVASSNPASRLLTPNLAAALENRLRVLASLRLLRMAVQHAVGEDIAPLPDPSGGVLEWAIDAKGDAQFWSDKHRGLARVRVPK